MIPKKYRPIVIAVLIALLISDFTAGRNVLGWITTAVTIILGIAYLIDFKNNLNRKDDTEK